MEVLLQGVNTCSPFAALALPSTQHKCSLGGRGGLCMLQADKSVHRQVCPLSSSPNTRRHTWLDGACHASVVQITCMARIESMQTHCKLHCCVLLHCFMPAVAVGPTCRLGQVPPTAMGFPSRWAQWTRWGTSFGCCECSTDLKAFVASTLYNHLPPLAWQETDRGSQSVSCGLQSARGHQAVHTV